MIIPCSASNCTYSTAFHVHQLSDVGGRARDLGRHHSGREPLLSPIIPTDNPTLDLELDWQDLFAIMEPEVSGRWNNCEISFSEKRWVKKQTKLDWLCILPLQNTVVDTMTSFNNVLESRARGTLPVESETGNLNCNNLDNGITDAHQDAHLVETPLQHGKSFRTGVCCQNS